MSAIDPPIETYKVYAVRYGCVAGRRRNDNFIVTDPHNGPMPLDYFVWAIVGDHRTVVVDTGFDHAEAAKRDRELLRLPREGLAMLGIDSRSVKDLIVTHLHYDHAGTLDDFPRADVHVQELEMSYACGRFMTHQPFRHAYSADHVKAMVDRVFNGQVRYHQGDSTIAPGLSVHHIGGHTMGLQCVRVHTEHGWMVLASDASHYYENMQTTSPFPIVHNLGDMVEGYAKMRRLAASEQQIVPGHDPLVMQRYAAPAKELQDIVVRLDLAPRQ